MIQYSKAGFHMLSDMSTYALLQGGSKTVSPPAHTGVLSQRPTQRKMAVSLQPILSKIKLGSSDRILGTHSI